MVGVYFITFSVIGQSWAIGSLPDALVPAALPSGVACRPPGVCRVIAAGPTPHPLKRVSRRILSGPPLVVPLPLIISVLVPLGALIPRLLATAGTRLILIHRSHLIRTIPVIRLVISSLVPEILAIIPPVWSDTIVAGIPLTRLSRVQQGLSWIAQCVRSEERRVGKECRL